MRLVLAAALLLVVTATSPVVQAADLYVVHKGHYGPVGKTRHFGRSEPWSNRGERPPRRGRYLRDDPIPRTVNALVPFHSYHRRPTPWTQAWFSYCAARWPSFNPQTGTIITPDGERMCL
ncbi:MAG: BA14K family protein [Pseudomonadota bacterium]